MDKKKGKKSTLTSFPANIRTGEVVISNREKCPFHLGEGLEWRIADEVRVKKVRLRCYWYYFMFPYKQAKYCILKQLHLGNKYG